MNLLISIAAFIALAASWLIAGGIPTALLGWLFALLFCIAVRRSGRLHRDLFVGGALCIALAFYWLIGTLMNFGGFNLLSALAIYALFVCGMALQFSVFAFFYRYLPLRLDKWGLRIPIAWMAGELLPIKIFPWHLGHTQLDFLYFAQAADIAGSQTVSFLMLWACAGTVYLIAEGTIKRAALFGPALAGLSIWYGSVMCALLTESALVRSYKGGYEQDVALIQGDIEVKRKHNLKYFTINTKRYKQLSADIAAAKQNQLIIWPETVIMEWIPDDIGNARRDRERVPFFPGSSVLFGSLSVTQYSEERHNSAFAVYPDGKMPRPYHKQILMPFGEYMPLAQYFPWLLDINPNANTGFTPDSDVRVFEFPLPEGIERHGPLRVSPLICYEDVVQDLSMRAVRKGADLLVNMTNDAWFGDTPAPKQHHLIAAFRSIENRRYLLRSTNSGLTAVVDHLGRTIAQAPVYSEQVLRARVKPLNYLSLFTRLWGAWPWWILSAFAACAVIYRRVIIRKQQ